MKGESEWLGGSGGVMCHKFVCLGLLRFPSAFSERTHVLSTTLVEPDKTDSLALTEGFVTEYIKTYVSTAPATGSAAIASLPEESNSLFLSRNLTAMGQDCSEEAVIGALEKFLVNNGLECKISCTSNKVSRYVDG